MGHAGADPRGRPALRPQPPGNVLCADGAPLSSEGSARLVLRLLSVRVLFLCFLPDGPGHTACPLTGWLPLGPCSLAYYLNSQWVGRSDVCSPLPDLLLGVARVIMFPVCYGEAP